MSSAEKSPGPGITLAVLFALMGVLGAVGWIVAALTGGSLMVQVLQALLLVVSIAGVVFVLNRRRQPIR